MNKWKDGGIEEEDLKEEGRPPADSLKGREGQTTVMLIIGFGMEPQGLYRGTHTLGIDLVVLINKNFVNYSVASKLTEHKTVLTTNSIRHIYDQICKTSFKHKVPVFGQKECLACIHEYLNIIYPDIFQ